MVLAAAKEHGFAEARTSVVSKGMEDFARRVTGAVERSGRFVKVEEQTRPASRFGETPETVFLHFAPREGRLSTEELDRLTHTLLEGSGISHILTEGPSTTRGNGQGRYHIHGGAGRIVIHRGLVADELRERLATQLRDPVRTDLHNDSEARGLVVICLFPERTLDAV